MNKIIKFSTKDQNIWIGSDYHYNHRPNWDVPICIQRGFSSTEEMNEYQIKITNELVKPDDIFIHLGDLTLNCNEIQFDNFISKLNCKRIICLWGNHPNPMYGIYKRELEKQFGLDSKEYELFPLKYKNIEFWGNYAEICVDGQILILNHYPILSWNHISHNSIHLFGHEHNKLKDIPWINDNYLKGRCMDVGFDCYKRPLNFKKILQIMKEKQKLVIGNHGK